MFAYLWNNLLEVITVIIPARLLKAGVLKIRSNFAYGDATTLLSKGE